MLEPTTTTDTQTQRDSKPIEILSCEQMTSLSAYASAESSPTNEYSLSGKPGLLPEINDEPCPFPKADSAPLNTYWGLPPATSLLIDEEDKLDALEHSREKLSMSKSFNNTKGN